MLFYIRYFAYFCKMKVKIKKTHKNAVIPSYAKEGDAGMDLTAVSRTYDKYGNICFGTGLSFEIPKGFVGLLFPRSSIYKQDISLTNCVGVIDSGFRGEVSFKFKQQVRILNPLSFLWNVFIIKKKKTDMKIYNIETNSYNIGDRVGQIVIMPYPKIEFEEVEELSKTERGLGGYGSTGK